MTAKLAELDRPETEDVLAGGTMSVKQAVQFCGIPRSTLYEAMSRGELMFGKHGKRRLVVKSSLLEMLRRGLVVQEK